MNEIVKREESQVAFPVERVLDAIIRAASDPSVDVGKMRELLSLQKEMMAMQAEQQFNEALARVRLPRIKKNGVVEYRNKQTQVLEKSFKFARWEDVSDAICEELDREGFRLSYDSVPRQGDGGGIIVTTILHHIAGHKERASIPVPLDTSGGKNNIQGYGSALSYGRRYTTTALLNLVAEGEDDDGKRGGTRYISEEKADDLRDRIRALGRQEGPFLDRLFAGAIRSCDEIEEGGAYNAALGTLTAMKQQMDAKAKE